ncbi:MAG: hypothetical protein MAGBODY4_00836 [Candidatus Marinimicrobia bacterium]|nr:hypothetical protein [Candidatus Neomarinimicrobiota bacterium]
MMEPRRIILPALFFLLLLVWSVPTVAQPLDSLSYGWGTIYYGPDEQKLAKSSAEKIALSLERIHHLLGLEVKEPFPVVIAPSKEVYKKYAGNLPEWSAGATTYPLGRIVLKSPSLGRSSIWDYDATLQHEVAHVIIGQHINPNRLPRWLNEGLAMSVADQHTMRDMYTLAQAALRDNLIPLDQIEQMLSFHSQRALLAYIQSHDAVRFIQQEFPKNTLARVFDFMQENPELSWSRSFEKIAGVSQFYFEWHWQKKVKQSYNWLTVLSSDTLFWLIFPVLAILAYLAIRWRNRKKMKRWQQEEEERDSKSDWDFEYLPDEDDKWRGDIH